MILILIMIKNEQQENGQDQLRLVETSLLPMAVTGLVQDRLTGPSLAHSVR
jgi:hypothetical protein